MPAIAKVIMELGLDREFDYRIPPGLQDVLQLGSMVRVPFGSSERTGYVIGFAETSERDELKSILEPVGKKPLIDAAGLELARWMAGYYLCPVEHAVRTLLPGAVRKKGAQFRERLMVRVTESGARPGAEKNLLRKAPKQAEVLKVLREDGPRFLQALLKEAGTTAQTVKALADKNLVQITTEEHLRDPLLGQTFLSTQALDMMPEQAEALATICRSIDTGDPGVVLLYGVTGSGKTEVYMQAIQHALDQGKGAVVLVPEISLTPQMVERFRGRFGEAIAILHSHLSDGERHDEWHRVYDGRARIAIGARSALFAPVRNLGLIVVDEEHENTYKQEESPRYHARDMAVMRGHRQGCAVVLGSATPSLESYLNVRRGKYHMAVLPARVDNRRMPAIRIIDLRQGEAEKGKRYVLSGDLRDAIDLRLMRGEQTILFLNRRGYSTSLICPKCGTVAQCSQCSVAMTYHRKNETLCCHLCGDIRGVPTVCPNPECRDPAFKYAGLGTQRVEEVVRRVFPGASVERMDADTTTAKGSHQRILHAFRTGKIDILIGTQMIAKGLHFPNVTLVGVILADSSLHMPDFRAGERTFQLLTQVAGRAGRGDVAGEVLVQTFSPFHPAIQAARRMDYEGFVDEELSFREELGYPPYGHLVCVTIRGPVEEQVALVAQTLSRQIKERVAEDPSVFCADAVPAPIARIKSMYRFQVMLRAPMVSRMTTPLREVIRVMRLPGKVTMQVDVDALSLL